MRLNEVKGALVLGTALVLTCGAGAAHAEIGVVDNVPAATLLLPYFAVDLDSDNGNTTLFSINNASASAAVAHVVLWTDQSIPTLDFDVYLTGYDVQTINLRDIFRGILPRTADAGADPGDTISNQGVLSQDVNFPGSTGPCASPYPVTGALSAALIDHLRKSHTGQFSALYGGCSGANFGDQVARGYVTVDSVVSCNLSFPSDAGYFTTLADNRNILWGDYFYVNPEQNLAQGDTLVHIEACNPLSRGAGGSFDGYVGNGAGFCPFAFAAGDYTFYGRYNAVAGQDQRESLGTTFASRFLDGPTFTAGTSLVVWRDSKTRPTAANGTHSCSTVPSWFPLNQGDVVAFDEQENPTDLCFQGDNVSPPTGGSDTCFPLEAQWISVDNGNGLSDPLAPPYDQGWLYLNLNHTLAAGDPYPGVAQAWVSTELEAEGRYGVGYDAVALDAALTAAAGGLILIP
jgi:hypothetical protein